MYNNSPINLYSVKLAEQVWKYLVVHMNDEELIRIDKGDSPLSETAFKKIIDYLNGEYINFNFEDQKMKNNVKKYNESDVEGNSYFVKTSSDNNFEIGMLTFDVIEASHELGHVFLDINSVSTNKVLWSTGSSKSSEYLVDSFCMAFAMPRERFFKIVSKFSRNNSCNIEQVANAFGVSYAFAYMRGQELLLWD